MPIRTNMLMLLGALAMVSGTVLADDKAAPPAPAPAPAKDAAPPSAQDRSDRAERAERSDNPDRDDRDDKRRSERRERPEGPRPNWSRGESRTSAFEQFSPQELREMISAVESKDKRLATKMKERFAEAIARKPKQLTEEQFKDAMGVFEDRDPSIHARLKQYHTKNPEHVNAILASQWPRLEKAIELKKNDPALYQAQTQEILRQNEGRSATWQLRLAIKAKNEAEVVRLKDVIREALAKEHKARQELRQLELKRMGDRIARLSEEITAEESKAAERIDAQFKQMVKWAETPFDRHRGDRGGDRGNRDEKHEKGDPQDQTEKNDSTAGDKPKSE